MNNFIPKLKQNATIAFIAPAGCITEKENIERAKKYFERLGYKVIFGENLFKRNKYMSGSDEERLADLHWAFADKSIDGIICARGGYGCLRLIDKIDYELIKDNKKFFCGYSDITVLSAMLLKRANLITYSGPMSKGDFGIEQHSQYTIENFFKTINKEKNIEHLSTKQYSEGNAEGILFGGNLASIVSLCGIDFIPDEKFIFFAEDLNEPVYKIDKMFTQLLNIEKFRDNVSGIILGEFLDTGYPEQLDELFIEISKRLNIPVLSGFKISHGADKITILYGAIGKIVEDKLIY